MTDSTDRIALGDLSDAAALARLVPVAGKWLIDVGCGPAVISRTLVSEGARVDGVEPDPVQAAKNRQAEPMEGLRLHEGRAESLPFGDGTVDGVMFFRSLHHVPIPAMDAALKEAARVLKTDGFLCVVEPGMTGSHFAVMKPFHDETEVRTQAQGALARMRADGLFREAGFYAFDQHPRHASFEAMVAAFTGATFNSITRSMVETDEVRALFEQGRTGEGDYVFEQPMLLDLYRGPVRA